MGKELDQERLQTMFSFIRKNEIKNDKTGKLDDKQMVEHIARYIMKVTKEEMGEEK